MSNRESAVPRGRLARLARFSALAGGIAGRAAVQGARQWATGTKPDAATLLLTPANIGRITDELARLRGAAMKMGQLVSMDSGEFLPPELGQIMARLREDAQAMPPKQLKSVLDRNWGPGWLAKFERFDVRPIAAASIGQVHRARLKDGRDLAIKVQYPGVRASIDSDVDNVGSLMRLSGLVPAHVDVASLLGEAKRQLHEEADYLREADSLAAFGRLLAHAPEFRVPGLEAGLTTVDVLAMEFLPGQPIEALATADQALRDRVMTAMMALVLRELFEFRLMQTDPNFANYRWNAETGRIVLLDFGATRIVPQPVADAYRRLMQAGLAGDRCEAMAAALSIGLFGADTDAVSQGRVIDMFQTAFAPIAAGDVFDFSTTDVAARLREDGLALAQDRSFWHLPPADTLFLQRKFGGLFLLGSRLKARVDVRALMLPWANAQARGAF
ncbi:ubiquinol-cytochrome c reductase [Polymorphobacter multimanifer]|uniref:Putative unusual protein kinase regulating ubiquinone biosynthesis (AarF/ABC1/UbiB family) n=1 Tax=Polymorphobacter multimanifer TaxID=1070431 RepID=A0A841L9D3_9SPHN|nr:AarF/ABC1/UbiB kinase family protein [Polymorphobacter multimanifer]MBB6226445.1 putative unusual protein kinase regulating ubiquinone biosynthesis (AarF/ABC1/UbiB family) [Polymorphobacter multimanifer]GGI67555.1 ubiquinol-cytochrome c reductase [Polymorphobacter multimanifer]